VLTTDDRQKQHGQVQPGFVVKGDNKRLGNWRKHQFVFTLRTDKQIQWVGGYQQCHAWTGKQIYVWVSNNCSYSRSDKHRNKTEKIRL
jgi:hypothetical protein